VWLIAQQELRERPRVELLEGKLCWTVFPRFVEAVVEPSQNLGHGVDHVEIGLRVEPLEERVRELEGINVPDVFPISVLGERLLEGLCCADVACPGGGGQDEDFQWHGSRPIA